MEKETIEANDLKFREKLQELRSSLASRQQSNQNRRNPKIFFTAAIIVIAVIAIAVFATQMKTQIYQAKSAPVSNQLQISDSKDPAALNHQFADQKNHGKATPEIERTTHSAAQDTSSADSVNEAPKLAELFALSKNKSVEASVGLSMNQNSENENSNQTGSSFKESNMEPPKADENGPSGPTDELNKSPLSHRTKISRLLTCSGVKSRECIEPLSVFVVNEHRNPHVWMEVHSDSTPYVLKHVYYHNGQKYCEVPLRIKFSRMRTWSNISLRNIKLIGSWRVEIVAEDGTVIDQTAFEVLPGS
jgi:hypothetical protein